MFKRDKHLQTESVLTSLCFITPGGVGGRGERSGHRSLDRAQRDT